MFGTSRIVTGIAICLLEDITFSVVSLMMAVAIPALYPMNPCSPGFSEEIGFQLTLGKTFLARLRGQNCRLPRLGLFAVGIS